MQATASAQIRVCMRVRMCIRVCVCVCVCNMIMTASIRQGWRKSYAKSQLRCCAHSCYRCGAVPIRTAVAAQCVLEGNGYGRVILVDRLASVPDGSVREVSIAPLASFRYLGGMI